MVELFLRLTVMGWLAGRTPPVRLHRDRGPVRPGRAVGIPHLRRDEVLRYFTILRLLRLRLLRHCSSASSWAACGACSSRQGDHRPALRLHVPHAFAGMYGGLIYEGNEDLADTDYRRLRHPVLQRHGPGHGVALREPHRPSSSSTRRASPCSPRRRRDLLGVLHRRHPHGLQRFASFIIDIFLALYEDQESPTWPSRRTSVIQTDGSKAGHLLGLDDIYQKLFLEKGSDEYNEVLDMFKKEAGVSED